MACGLIGTLRFVGLVQLNWRKISLSGSCHGPDVDSVLNGSFWMKGFERLVVLNG